MAIFIDESGPPDAPRPEQRTPEAPGPDQAPPKPEDGASWFKPQVPKEAFVSNQLERLLSDDSDWLKSAHTRALQGKNKLGLLNTSMAIQAGEQARINAALPIAQQDAASVRDEYMQGQQQKYNLERQGFAQSQALQLQYTASIKDLQLATENAVSNIMIQPDMSPGDKDNAIRDLYAQRDADLIMLNEIYGALPGWQSDWTLKNFPGFPFSERLPEERPQPPDWARDEGFVEPPGEGPPRPGPGRDTIPPPLPPEESPPPPTEPEEKEKDIDPYFDKRRPPYPAPSDYKWRWAWNNRWILVEKHQGH
jgi:hypothetical protein